jgi:type IV pilus assembly protein PilA
MSASGPKTHQELYFVKTGQEACLLRCYLRRHNRGFTLLEVTIVLVISGILAAIALPSFLDQASKAKQVEAKMYLGTLNRAQQGYMLERARFADSVSELGVTLYNSPNYSYSIQLDSAGTQYAVHDAKALGARLRPYVGMVAVAQDSAGNARLDTILCESKTAQQGQAEQPVLSPASVACATSTAPVDQ